MGHLDSLVKAVFACHWILKMSKMKIEIGDVVEKVMGARVFSE